jgi:hypothetical protein
VEPGARVSRGSPGWRSVQSSDPATKNCATGDRRHILVDAGARRLTSNQHNSESQFNSLRSDVSARSLGLTRGEHSLLQS